MAIFKDIQTQGIFQHGSHPQQHYFKYLKPYLFNHIVASVALIRPGPMNMDIHMLYAEAMNGETEVVYEHPDLEEYLGSTYGFIVYQEQMMQIARGIAGFTGSEADHVRKACGKKKPEEMAKWEVKFKEQSVERGYTQELVDKLWDVIVSFAEYSFNKSHSVCYTLISYYEAYIKAHYPIEFWCALLNTAKKSDAKGKDSIHSLKGTIERMGIEFVYPTVKGFAIEFSPAGENQIYWPLAVLKGFGPTKVEYLKTLDEDSFSSLEHMLETVNTSVIGKGVVENMIRAGFFTPLEPQWVTARKYYMWRAQQESNKLKNPQEIEVYFERENIPPDMLSEDPLDWAMSRNKAYGSTMESWKDVAKFHHKVKRYTKKQYESREKGVKLFIGGRVDRIVYKQDKKGGWFVTMTITDGDERYTVRGWSSHWESRHLDEYDKRPENGDLVELIGIKDIWSPEPGKSIHSITMDDPEQYLRIVNRNFAI
jgi:DNA polymerase III alpha subunit